ncbi:MAG: preprotein translocase subunit YajC [Cytophagales bacterium]|nr:preprotein translocase subunit YajC [Cytophagales bacterium]MDW8384572.1 preprotein translocase subunit YajC [Flammeovirgaceae bacterium]
MYSLFLQASGGRADYSMLVLFIGMIIVMYFFTIRPQQRKAKEQKKFQDNLKKGDNVVTIGGLHGKVVGFEKDCVLIEVCRGTVLKFDKSSISYENTKASYNIGEVEKNTKEKTEVSS